MATEVGSCCFRRAKIVPLARFVTFRPGQRANGVERPQAGWVHRPMPARLVGYVRVPAALVQRSAAPTGRRLRRNVLHDKAAAVIGAEVGPNIPGDRPRQVRGRRHPRQGRVGVVAPVGRRPVRRGYHPTGALGRTWSATFGGPGGGPTATKPGSSGGRRRSLFSLSSFLVPVAAVGRNFMRFRESCDDQARRRP